MAGDLKTDWHQDLKPRIDQHFQSIRNVGDISKQLLLASRHQDEARMKPSLVILCLSKRYQRAILKGFNSKDWRERLREKGIKLRVIVDKNFGEKVGGNKVGRLGALPSLSGSNYNNTVVFIALHSTTKSICGGQIRRLERTDNTEAQRHAGELDTLQKSSSHTTTTNKEQSTPAFATIGGIVSINGVHYGLTIAHAFGRSPLLGSLGGADNSNESLDQSQVSLGTYASSSSQSFEETLAESIDECYEVRTIVDEQEQNNILSPSSVVCPDTSFRDGGSIVAYGLGEHRESCFAIREQSTTPLSRPIECSDWALVMIHHSFDLPNLLIEPDSGRVFAIDGMKKESDIHSGEVWVIAGRTKTQAGVVNDASASVTLHQSHFVVRQVRLQHSLEAGDSGAWVIQDGKVCGMIIAASGLLPWAYMLPIEKVFADIQYTIGGGDVKLPHIHEEVRRSLQLQNLALQNRQPEKSTETYINTIDLEDSLSKAQSRPNFPMDYAARLQHHASGPLAGIQFRELSAYLLSQPRIFDLGYDQTSVYNFVTLYNLNNSGSQIQQYYTAKEFYATHESLNGYKSSLLFMQGYPSPDWLNVIGSKYRLDPNFFQAHLHSLFTDDHFRHPSPPSAAHILTLRITTIGHRLSYCLPKVLDQPTEVLRSRSSLEMKRYLRNMQLNHGKAFVGDSIVRDFSVFDENYFSIEQDVSICLNFSAKDNWDSRLILPLSMECALNSYAVTIWLDTGRELEKGPDGPWQASGPWALSNATEFLPIINQQSLNLYDPQNSPDAMSPFNSSLRSRRLQHVSLLPQCYGKTLEPGRLARDPFYAITEIVELAVASEVQFLNLIAIQLANKRTVQSDLSTETVLSDMSYIKDILARHIERLELNLKFIKNRGGSHWARALPPSLERHPKEEKLCEDIEYLVERARSMETICSNFTCLAIQRMSVHENNAARRQSRSIILFSIISTIFLPLSFMTSLFSMNISQFNANSSVSIWVWVIPSVIMMLISLFILGLIPRHVPPHFERIIHYLQHAVQQRFLKLYFVRGSTSRR